MSSGAAQIMDPLTRELSKIEEEAKEKQNANITQYLTVQKFSVVDVLTENKVRIHPITTKRIFI